ncbi:alkaline phosphatase D family protein [Halomicroarcula sp. GCM10025710]
MPDESPIDAGRRRVLAAILAAALPLDRVARAHSVTDLPTASVTDATGGQSGPVFPQGVASGDPTTSGVVLWTRVAPDAVDDGTALQVTVAHDDAFADPVGSWSVPADRLGDHDGTVKVDLDGRLDADSTYWYRFDCDGVASPTGRCRTLPAADASPDSVRLALATCQNYRRGYYGAFHHLASEPVDFLVHLGDFIYERGGAGSVSGRSLSLPSGESVAMGLEDYRYLHRTYRSDAFLQEALSAHTLVQTWDDHEIVNNRYWNYSEERPYAGDGDHPKNDDAAFMTQLFADGIRAWWEYTPTRVPYDPDAETLLDQLRLWKSFRFGDLVELLVTDERLFRTSPTDGSLLAARPDDGDDSESEDQGNESDLTETMLGSAQRDWFTDRLAESDAAWTAWVNEVLAMEFDLDLGAVDVLNADAWDAFPEERERILDSAEEGDAAFVALTGDMHSTLTGYVERDGERVGVEFMTPAVTSRNLSDLLSLPDDREVRKLIADYVKDENPHVEFFDSHRWGYAVVEFTTDACTFSAYAVDRSANSADASRRLLTRYRCPVDSHDLSRT